MALPEGYFSDENDSQDEGLTFPDDDVINDKKHKSTNEIELNPGQKLINAILDRNLEMVSELLKQKTDTNYSDKAGWTPLMYASSLGLAEHIDELLKHGACSNFHYLLTTPLICVCDSTSFDDEGLLKSFNLLIESGASINICDANRMTPLMHATARGHMQLVARLIELGSDLEMSDNDGWTAIFYAVNSGDVHMVQMLKDAGCDLKLIDAMGRSLHNLARARNFIVIDEIVSEENRTSDIIQQLFDTKNRTNYQLITSDLPNYNNSDFNGFSQDTIKTIVAIGLSNLACLFIDKKIGYGQFLTYDEEEWKNVGVEMSFDRKKLTYCANRVIQKKWSLDAFLKKDEEFSMLNLIHCLTNNVRIIHVLISTFYACEKELSASPKISSMKMKVLLKNCLEELKLLKVQMRKMDKVLEILDKLQPADFIEKNNNCRN